MVTADNTTESTLCELSVVMNNRKYIEVLSGVMNKNVQLMHKQEGYESENYFKCRQYL